MYAELTAHDTLEPDVAIGEPKTGLFVVRLLRDDSVKNYVAISRIGHAMSPDAHTKAHAAELGFDEVEADEAESLVIGNRRDASHGLASQRADEKVIRICRAKTTRIVLAGVPPLR